MYKSHCNLITQLKSLSISLNLCHTLFTDHKRNVVAWAVIPALQYSFSKNYNTTIIVSIPATVVRLSFHPITETTPIKSFKAHLCQMTLTFTLPIIPCGQFCAIHPFPNAFILRVSKAKPSSQFT